jgi:hypothetical protein
MCTTVQAASAALPQGPSLRSGLCCPSPSSLIWSHAPHLQAQLDFTAMRLIRAAFAVRPISAPRRPTRVDPCFRWHTFSTCRPPGPTGSSFGCLYPVPSPMTLAFDQRGNGLGTSNFPTLRFSWGDPFSRLHYGSLSLRPADLLALLSELTGFSPSQRGLLLSGFRRIDHSLRRRI